MCMFHQQVKDMNNSGNNYLFREKQREVRRSML